MCDWNPSGNSLHCYNLQWWHALRISQLANIRMSRFRLHYNLENWSESYSHYDKADSMQSGRNIFLIFSLALKLVI